MNGIKLNDWDLGQSAEYLYAQQAGGKQVRITPATAGRLLGLSEARNAAQEAAVSAEESAELAENVALTMEELERIINALAADPDIDAALLAKVSLNAAKLAMLEAEMQRRPVPNYMTQAEFDRLTRDGENLTPIRHIENLIVYEPYTGEDVPDEPSAPSSVMAADGTLSLDAVIAEDGTLSLNAVISADGTLTL